jgi:hypothetical protein
MKPGKYDDISLPEYHKMPEWSKSMLDHINKSPAHYIEWKANPPEPTDSMKMGLALHCAVLTPALYDKEYVVKPECDRRTKEGKKIYSDFMEECGDKTAISAIDAGKVAVMVEKIYHHSLASQLLSNGEAEQSFFWTNPKTGIECKARPDYLRHDNICIELKLTHSLIGNAFQRTSFNFRYHVQGAYFIDGIFHAVERQCEEFVIVAIENEPPHGIKVFVMDDLAIDTGRIEYQDDLETVKQWQEHPELFKSVYVESDKPIELSLPLWA